MPTDFASALALVKEGGGLALLAWTLFRGVPAIVAALDRNSRILYRIEGKLGITDTDRIPEQRRQQEQ